MKPKEKAVELVDKFHSDVDDCDKHYAAEADGRMCSHMAKQCALICVDEIIASDPVSPVAFYYGSWADRRDDAINYWSEVKTEIQNL